MNKTDLWTVSIILGLAIITVVTRSFFFLSSKEWTLPHWVERGLQYAPVAALAAVIIPEIVMTQGHLISTWKDARLFAVAGGALCFFFWRRDVLVNIVAGTIIYLALHVGLGW